MRVTASYDALDDIPTDYTYIKDYLSRQMDLARGFL